MKNRYLILLAGLLVAGSMLLVACGDKNDKPADTKSPTAAQTDPATDPEESSSTPEESSSAADESSTPAEESSSTPAEESSSTPADESSTPEESSSESTDEPVAPEVETMVATPSAAILYAGFADTINGVPMENGWDTVYGYTTLDESGKTTYIEIVREGVTTVDGKINFTGAAFAEGGQDKLFYSVDGVNWIEITETTYSAIEVENIFMVFWAGNHGITEAGVVIDNALYNAVLDLSAHAGETVDVYVAVRSVATHEGAQQICHLFTFNDVTVA